MVPTSTRSRTLLPGRLTDPSTVWGFVDFMLAHGALGREMRPAPGVKHGDADVFRYVPLAFGLMPVGVRQGFGQPLIRLRPQIKLRLEELGIVGIPNLEDVVFALSDQYRSSYGGSNYATRTRKLGIEDLRARPTQDKLIRSRQGSRCASCGCLLKDTQETLDHIVPWQLIGDVDDGCNWQILCSTCNSGKGSNLSSLLGYLAHGWLYGYDLSGSKYWVKTRYAVLKRDVGCTQATCSAGPTSAQLFVRLVSVRGLHTIDNLVTVCEAHTADDSVPPEIARTVNLAGDTIPV